MTTLRVSTRILLIVLLSTAAVACSSIVQRNLELRSNPDGAEVFDLQGKRLGVTPLKLEGDALNSVVKEGRAEVQFRAIGYGSQKLVMDVHGQDVQTVQLNPVEEGEFSLLILDQFSKKTNQLTRELLHIHGLVIGRRLPEAEEALKVFQNNYPGIAAGYALSGNIALLKGNASEARQLFLRAKSLDPYDPVVSRMLNASQLKEGGTP